MELSKTIKRLRTEKGWSQEALAERAYVSRQTVSNWETEKSFPDVHSLLILSDLFGISLDEMVKGDVAAMKETVRQDQTGSVRRLMLLCAGSMLALMVIPSVLTELCGEIGLLTGGVLAGMLAAVTFFAFHRYQQTLRENDIQTKRELLAFLSGETLDEIEQAKELKKRKALRMATAITAAVTGAALLAALCYAGYLLTH